MIWENKDMYESLNLQQSKISITTFSLIAIIIFIGLAFPAYHFLRPIYIQINNPYFVWGYIAIAILVFICLGFYNRKQFDKIIKSFDKDSFVYHFDPNEMVYLKNLNLTQVIDSVIDGLITKKIITIENNSLELNKPYEVSTIEEFQVTNTLNEKSKFEYSTFLEKLKYKPIFLKTKKTMQAFLKYLDRSPKLAKIYKVNFIVLFILLMLGVIRIITGATRDKPVFEIALICGLLLLIIIFSLRLLLIKIPVRLLPVLYKKEILPKVKKDEKEKWKYFVKGFFAYNVIFITMMNRNSGKTSDSGSGSSCGGSSCGSSYGGCGGGD